ncbi:hypothetical protein C8Q77DRAFT_588104 [Trametes polyzona]|nr:hypothetical protein C8Q77DRAFT_588104 [Trametes polyzona]
MSLGLGLPGSAPPAAGNEAVLHSHSLSFSLPKCSNNMLARPKEYLAYSHTVWQSHDYALGNTSDSDSTTNSPHPEPRLSNTTTSRLEANHRVADRSGARGRRRMLWAGPRKPSRALSCLANGPRQIPPCQLRDRGRSTRGFSSISARLRRGSPHPCPGTFHLKPSQSRRPPSRTRVVSASFITSSVGSLPLSLAKSALKCTGATKSASDGAINPATPMARLCGAECQKLRPRRPERVWILLRAGAASPLGGTECASRTGRACIEPCGPRRSTRETRETDIRDMLTGIRRARHRR